jgi:GT2 family glycosyltransferase
MSLITMCCHDTIENGRGEYTRQTLDCLFETVDHSKHRIIIVDNNSCSATKDMLYHFAVTKRGDYYHTGFNNRTVITLGTNIGTSRGLNQAWQYRQPGEHVIKIDNDVVIHSKTWIEEMEEAIERKPDIGILGLKRKDIIQTTWHPDPTYRSSLVMLPHEPGQRWINFEQTADVIGTCTMFNHRLLDKVGYSWQPGLYGFEDVLFCHRSHLAGFVNGFLNHINMDHIDRGGNGYIDWKQKVSGEKVEEMIQVFRDYVSGKRPIYEPFY